MENSSVQSVLVKLEFQERKEDCLRASRDVSRILSNTDKEDLLHKKALS